MTYETKDKKYLFRIQKEGKKYNILMADKFGFNWYSCGSYEDEGRATEFVTNCLDTGRNHYMYEYITRRGG